MKGINNDDFIQDEVEEEEGTDALTDCNLTNTSATDNDDNLLSVGNQSFQEQSSSQALIQGLEGLDFSSNSSSSDLNGLSMNSEQSLLGQPNQIQDALSHQQQNYFTSPANPPPVLMPIQCLAMSRNSPDKSVFDQHPNANIPQMAAAPTLMPTTNEQESAQSNHIIGQSNQQSTRLIGQSHNSNLPIGQATFDNRLIGQAQESNQLTEKHLQSNLLIGQAHQQKASQQQGIYQLDSTPSLTPNMPGNPPIGGLEKVTLEDIPPENDDVFEETSVEVDWNDFTS